MRDQPVAIDLAVAIGRAHPQIGFLAIGHGSTNPFEAVTEGHTVARSDAQVANFDIDRTLVLGEEVLVVFLIRIRPEVLQALAHRSISCRIWASSFAAVRAFGIHSRETQANVSTESATSFLMGGTPFAAYDCMNRWGQDP